MDLFFGSVHHIIKLFYPIYSMDLFFILYSNIRPEVRFKNYAVFILFFTKSFVTLMHEGHKLSGFSRILLWIFNPIFHRTF